VGLPHRGCWKYLGFQINGIGRIAREFENTTFRGPALKDCWKQLLSSFWFVAGKV